MAEEQEKLQGVDYLEKARELADSYKVHGFSIQYRRYLTTAAKRERGEAV